MRLPSDHILYSIGSLRSTVLFLYIGKHPLKLYVFALADQRGLKIVFTSHPTPTQPNLIPTDLRFMHVE